MRTFLFSLKGWTLMIVFIIIVSIFTGCSKLQIQNEFDLLNKGKKKPVGIGISYPIDGTIFPPEFPAPNFEWDIQIANTSKYNVFITDAAGQLVVASTCFDNEWRPDALEWENLKLTSKNTELSFTVIAEKGKNEYYPSARMQFSFSKDSVGADIFFRAVTLPFSYAVKNVNTIEWYMGSVDGSEPRKMLDNLPVCGNCHSFSSDKKLLAMDVDYGNDKGSYVIAETNDTCSLIPDDIITWSDYKKEDKEPTFGLLSQISPDGNYVLSTVKDLSIFLAVDDNLAYSQLFFPIKGIIGFYDRQKMSFGELDGANDPKYVQSNPSWSPDGNTVVFAKNEAYINEKVRKAGNALLSLNDVAEFSTGGKEFKYDLYALDFNNGKGGEAKPLKGASLNGKSNYFPKFSPDGKWIVFCQADNYMLLQPDSRLYIIPSGGGEARLMNCNMDEMNSWHSWSPNGRWLVFSSKNRGLYTQLYLTHIDKNGIDSPPVLLENLSFDERAANIPEFYPFDSQNFKIIEDGFSNTAEYFNRGAYDKISYKFYVRAFDDLDKAFEADSNFLETYFNRIKLNSLLHQSNSFEDIEDKRKAMKLIADSVSKKTDDINILAMNISLLSIMGKENEAIIEAEKAVNKYPDNYRFYELLSSIYRKEKQFKKALKCYAEMKEINANNRFTINNLIASACMELGEYDKALHIVNQSIKEKPDDINLFYFRAQIMLNRGESYLAKNDLDKIILQDSTNYKYTELLAKYYLVEKNKGEYIFQMKEAARHLNNIYKENEEDLPIVFIIARIYMEIKEYKSAEKLYDIILSYFPENYEALKQKAKINLSEQHWTDVIVIYNKLEKNYPLEEGICNNKAIVYIQLGDFTKALEYFNKTLKMNPENKDAVFNRNRLLKELEKVD